MDQELQMVKNVLKSLLIVVPHGMTVAQLEKDFWEMEGRAIPFRRFSFNSLLEFLNSIPDTLFVSVQLVAAHAPANESIHLTNNGFRLRGDRTFVMCILRCPKVAFTSDKWL